MSLHHSVCTVFTQYAQQSLSAHSGHSDSAPYYALLVLRAAEEEGVAEVDVKEDAGAGKEELDERAERGGATPAHRSTAHSTPAISGPHSSTPQCGQVLTCE